MSIGLTLFNGGPVAETIDPRPMLAQARRLQQAPGAGNLRRAGALYRRALASGHTMLGLHSRIEAWTEIGHVESRLGDLRAEIAAYETALGLVRQLADRAAEAGVLNDLGRARRKAGDLGAARKAYETALVAAQVATNVREEATALNNLARMAYIAGDAQAAIRLYDKALGLWQHAGDSSGEAITLSNLGEAYVLLGRPEDGIDFYTRALRILEVSGNDRAAAATWTMMGWARFALGEREEALQAYLRAAALQDRAGDIAGRAGTLDRLGTAYRKLGRLDMAFATYRESLRISGQSGSVLDAGNTRFNLCELYLESNRLGKAEAECGRARQLLAAVEDRSAAAHGWFLSAQIARRRGQFGRAQDCIEQALAVVDELWQQPGSRALRASFLAARRSYFDFYLDLLLARHSADPGAGWDAQAFKLSERLRTRGLVDALLDKRDQERERGDAGPTILSQDDTLRLRIEALLSPAAGELNDPVHLSRLRSLRRQRDAELGGGADSRPRPALLSAQVPTLAAAQRTLADERTAILIYAVAERSSVLWVVTSERIETHLLPGRSTLQAQVAALERLLESEPQSSTETQTQIVLRQIGRTLLDPAASGLRAHRLVVVPDGPLHFVPFAALPVPRRLGSPGNEPLLEQHEILTSRRSRLSSRARACATRAHSRGKFWWQRIRFSMPRRMPVAVAARFETRRPRALGPRRGVTGPVGRGFQELASRVNASP